MITRDEIIKMARDKFACTYSPLPVSESRIEAFFQVAYEAGAAAEREACAKVCDTEWNGDSDTHDEAFTANFLAALIRARSAK